MYSFLTKLLHLQKRNILKESSYRCSFDNTNNQDIIVASRILNWFKPRGIIYEDDNSPPFIGERYFERFAKSSHRETRNERK